MAKPSYVTKAQPNQITADQTLLTSQMVSLGWEQIPMMRHNQRRLVEEPFLCFHRTINNPVIFRNVPFSKNPTQTPNAGNRLNTGVQTVNLPGANFPMGVTHTNFAPNGEEIRFTPAASGVTAVKLS